MRVLHVVYSFSQLSETFIYDYITELERQGIDNHILTFERVNKADRPFDKVFVAKIKMDISWIFLRVLNGFNFKPDRFWALQRRAIIKIVKNLKPDIIHAHFGDVGTIVQNVALMFQVPLVVTFYGFDASSLLRQKFWESKYKKLWHSVRAITVLSEHMKNDLANSGCPKDKLNIIHLGRRYSELIKINIPQKVRNFISIGRLVEKKGHIDLLKALKEVLNLDYDIKLKIIGDGFLFDELKHFLIENNLTGHVTLAGALNNEETINQLSDADAFILCSKTAGDGDKEGTPTVLVEAQSIGLPCISTFHSGIPEMIPVENHKFLAEEGNIEQIKNCIMRLIETDSAELQKIIERGRKKIEDEFNLEIEVKKLVEVYKLSLQ